MNENLRSESRRPSRSIGRGLVVGFVVYTLLRAACAFAPLDTSEDASTDLATRKARTGLAILIPASSLLMGYLAYRR